MKRVLHLWMGDSPQSGGGGGGSMYRLHSNLRKAGIDSRILCEVKTSHDPFVFTKPRANRVEKMIHRVTRRLGLLDIHRISSWKVVANRQFQQADIINIHGTHSGFLSYLALPQLTAAKPTVYTIRDMWSMTGHCAFSGACEKWKTGCGRCPDLRVYPPVSRDATALQWKLKHWAYRRSQMTIVAISHWMAQQAHKSMLNRFPVQHIYNGVDTDVYEPLDKNMARKILGIPQASKVLMCSAVNLSDPRKGGDLLIKALSAIPRSMNTVLLTMGNKGKAIARQVDMPLVDLGYVADQRIKCLAFSASDLFLFPSRGEALGQVLLESLACGTPVITQNLGPLPETIRPGITGLLANREDPADFARKIIALLEDDPLRQNCGRNSRKIALSEFSSQLETHRYIELYQHLYRARHNSQ